MRGINDQTQALFSPRKNQREIREFFSDLFLVYMNYPAASYGAFSGIGMSIPASCTNCGICNRFCPTGALRAHEGNLLFAPNCHLCEDVCYDKAIEPLTEIPTDQFFTEKPLKDSNAT